MCWRSFRGSRFFGDTLQKRVPVSASAKSGLKDMGAHYENVSPGSLIRKYFGDMYLLRVPKNKGLNYLGMVKYNCPVWLGGV